MKKPQAEISEHGIHKFISLMKSLTEFIQQDFSHQLTIYECLNSQEMRRLFESIHEEEVELRMASIRFISYLIHDNSKIIELICLMMAYPYSSDHRKFIIGGLSHYALIGCDLRSIILAIKKVKYQPGLIAWAIDLKQYQVKYYIRGSQGEFPFDPKSHVVGLFTRPQQERERQKERKMSYIQRGKYKISKK